MNEPADTDDVSNIVPDARYHRRRRLWFIICETIVVAGSVIRFFLVGLSCHYAATLDWVYFAFCVALVGTAYYYLTVGERLMGWGGITTLIFAAFAQPPVFSS